MIDINNITQSIQPYRKFKKFYEIAYKLEQPNIEAMAISSFSKSINSSNIRLVNLKMIHRNDFIFFSNYESQKAIEFSENNNISCLLFWNLINLQVRMRGTVVKSNKLLSDKFFANRKKEKNALAISSNQSKVIESYKCVKKKYDDTFSKGNLGIRPKYWGGYSFKPNYFEFWEGNDFRINKRTVFELTKSNIWKRYYLEP